MAVTRFLQVRGSIGLIVDNVIRQIFRNWLRQSPKFCKLQVISEIFKYPARLGHFCHINYLFELFSGYPSYPIQKWYIWASFQTSRKRFPKLQEATWLALINEIFKVQSHFKPLLSTKLFE